MSSTSNSNRLGRRDRATTVCAALILLVACVDRDVQPPIALSPILEQAEAFEVQTVVSALTATMGAPLVDRRPFPSPYDPAAIDTLRTLRYEGLTVEIYRVSSSGQELLQSLAVSSARFDAGLGFGVGANRQQVREVLGEPGRAEAGVWSWDFYQGAEDPTPTALTLRFDDEGRVIEMRWEFYLG